MPWCSVNSAFTEVAAAKHPCAAHLRERGSVGPRDRAKDVNPTASGWAQDAARTLCADERRSPPRLPLEHSYVIGAGEKGPGLVPSSAIGPTKTFVPATPREGPRVPESRSAFHRSQACPCVVDRSQRRSSLASPSRRPTRTGQCRAALEMGIASLSLTPVEFPQAWGRGEQSPL